MVTTSSWSLTGQRRGGSVSTFEDGDIDGDGDITNADDYDVFIDADVFGTVFVVWSVEFQLGDLDIDLDVDFDDNDDFVAALNIAFSDYIEDHLESFPEEVQDNEDLISQIVTEAIGDIDDDDDIDFDDIDDFAALLKGISGTGGQLLPEELT